MRLSSIDIGSNAIRQIIVEVDDHYQWEVLKKERFPIRLGHDVFNSKRIQEPTLQLMIGAFQEFARNNRNFRVQKVKAVATSAMRDALNASEVIRRILQTSKIKIEVIRGQEEANYHWTSPSGRCRAGRSWQGPISPSSWSMEPLRAPRGSRSPLWGRGAGESWSEDFSRRVSSWSSIHRTGSGSKRCSSPTSRFADPSSRR